MGPRRVVSGIILLIYFTVAAHAATRVAIVANGQFPAWEGRVVDSLTTKLAGKEGLALIDRASIERILREQNFQNSDRSSLDTAARIGKLVGAREIVIIQVTTANYSPHQESPSKGDVKTIGTVVLQASARVIDVETAVILAQPSSNFQDSALISETKTKGPVVFGPYRSPGGQKTTGSDPQIIQNQEIQKAVDAVSQELGSDLVTVLASAPAPKAEMPLVAGIANGSVFINEGTSSGIKQGERFQVVRSVNVGLNDPKTGKPITQRQKICVLTLANVDESNSSGSCQGGLPQSGDVAEPLK